MDYRDELIRILVEKVTELESIDRYHKGVIDDLRGQLNEEQLKNIEIKNQGLAAVTA